MTLHTWTSFRRCADSIARLGSQALRRAGVRDPALLLDEIDKMGADHARGDPAAALLEVCDDSVHQNVMQDGIPAHCTEHLQEDERIVSGLSLVVYPAYSAVATSAVQRFMRPRLMLEVPRAGA